VNRFVLVLLSIVALQGCSATLRDVQHATNACNLYCGADAKEEIVWKIRSIYGQ
jgi:uncharacterized protein YceK